MNDLFAPAALSVSGLNSIARQLLENQLDGLWISGEISNLTRAASGHYYFALKDAHAQVRCALFRQTATRLAIPLKDGDHIELTGKISIYEARGEYQITVNDMRTLGLGDLYVRYEKLKNTLQNEGLFDSDRKKRLPEKPRAIGIVTSLAAAALRDVASTLRRRAPHIPIIVYPTPVQGAGSEKKIAQAIELANKRNEVDVLLICRGGGSMEDLWAFNEEIVARTIAASQLPTVSGVGHETDFTLADFVADVRAPTPTAAAELVSPNQEEIIKYINQLYEKLQRSITQHYQNASQQLDFLAKQIRHPREKLNIQKQQLEIFQAALSQNMAHHFAIQQTRLQHASALLNAVAPQNVLQRGFAMVQTTRGKVVQSSGSLKTGQKLRLVFADGTRDVRVENNPNGELFD